MATARRFDLRDAFVRMNRRANVIMFVHRGEWHENRGPTNFAAVAASQAQFTLQSSYSL